MNVMYTSLQPIQMVDNPVQRLSELNHHTKSADDLAPIFPPPNFEVPDIRFSNSVSPNAEFNQSLFSSAHMYNSTALFMNPEIQSRHQMGDGSCGANHHQKSHSPVDALGLDVSGRNQQQVACFPPASSSPLETSSSDDTDDAPSSQFTNHVETSSIGTNMATNNSAPQPADAASVSTVSTAGSATKKSKACKRKKRKDPNEPQKPVSAYALFFRDSQAAIKGHNPSASFGEVSKIVASMWDQLNPEHKEVYKKKTELAKKQYLKQLAAYRASQVSQLAPEDTKKAPLSPGNRSRPDSAEDMTVSASFHNPDSHLQASLAGHILAQQTTLPSAHLVQMSPHLLQQHQQQHQQQHHQLHHHHQQHLQHRHQLSMDPATSPSRPHQQHCTSQHSPRPGPVYTSYTPQVDQEGLASFQPLSAGHNGFDLSDTAENTNRTYHQYPDNGCSQHTRGHPRWETEYYNSESVIPQCRDVFTNWMGCGSNPNTSPVK